MSKHQKKHIKYLVLRCLNGKRSSVRWRQGRVIEGTHENLRVKESVRSKGQFLPRTSLDLSGPAEQFTKWKSRNGV